MNIAQILTEQATIRPDAPAMIDVRNNRGRTTTFAEMDRASARAATLLLEAGLQPGNRVLVLQPMSAELYIVLAALFRLGLTAMFLDPSAGREHIARCCALASPHGFIGSSKAHLLSLLVPDLRRIRAKFVIGFPFPGSIAWSRADRVSPHSCFHPCDPDTPALLTFTSGSTGQPKAALRTHGFLLAQHRALERTIGLPEGVMELATLPVFALANLAAGLTSLIPEGDLRSPGKVDPVPILAQIDSHQPTRVAASPAFLERIADRCLREGRSLPGFRQIFTGGAPVFPRLLEKLRSVAPEAEITAVYGSTEAEPIAEIRLDDIRPEDREAMIGGRGLLSGPPVRVVQLRILRSQWGTPVGPYTVEEFDAACLPLEEPGEIVVNGKHVLPGYLHGEGDEETKFRVDGTRWHRTGDAGYLDRLGRLWLLGRCSATIKDTSGALYPFAVECAAHHQAGVRRAALINYENQRLLVLEAEPARTIDTEAIYRTLAWAKLDRVLVMKEIPVDKRHNAKVDYPALRKLLTARSLDKS